MNNKIHSLAVLFLIYAATGVYGQNVLNSLEEIAAFGSGHNLEYKSSLVDVLIAEEDRTSYFLFEESSITTESSFSNSNDNNSWGLSSSLTIPLIEQLSLTGEISEDLDSEIGMIFSPLAHSDTREQGDLAFNSAMITAEKARIYAENDTVSAALKWMISKRDLNVLVKTAELSEIQYNDDKVRYEISEITLDDLQESLISWSESRIDLTEEQKNFHVAQSTLYSALGSGINEVTVKELKLEDLLKSLEIIKASFDREMGDPLKSDSYLIAILDVNSAEANLNNTWAYDPELKTTANLVFDNDDEENSFNINATVSFTLSLDDFQMKKRTIAKEELQIKISEAEQSRFEAELEFEQILDSIISAEINSEISLLEFKQSKILLSEAELLQKLGDSSLIELEESQLTVLSSENAYFEALSDEYIAWVGLKKYF